MVGLTVAAFVGVGAAVVRLPQTRRAVIVLFSAVQEGGWLVLPQFVLIQIAVAAFGVLPASLMAVTAGVAYGLWAGFLLSAIATMLGGWIAFGLARSILRPWIARLFTRSHTLKVFDEVVIADGWRSVCLMRISPVMPFAATSYGLGLTGVPLRDFLIGTLASLPALLGYVAVGAFGKAGIAFGRVDDGWFRWALSLFGILAILIAVRRLQAMVRRRLASTSAPIA